MMPRTDSAYRLRLSEGFLKESEEDFKLSRWRSCVDNSQMSVEKGAKAIIAAVSPVEKTHNPSDQIRRLLKNGNLDASLVAVIEEALPLFDKLGFETHLLSDYGDESAGVDPWEIFDVKDAEDALKLGRKCFDEAKEVYEFYFGARD